jgi:hypothetical protein
MASAHTNQQWLGEAGVFVPITPQQQYDHHEMSRRGRLGARRQHALHDARETTRAAHAAFLDGFLREVDPDHVLPEQERQRRARHARIAHMHRLAQLSKLKRQARKLGGVA